MIRPFLLFVGGGGIAVVGIALLPVHAVPLWISYGLECLGALVAFIACIWLILKVER